MNGGDLSGEETDSYRDIETSVAPKVGQVDVYNVPRPSSSRRKRTSGLSLVPHQFFRVGIKTENAKIEINPFPHFKYMRNINIEY